MSGHPHDRKGAVTTIEFRAPIVKGFAFEKGFTSHKAAKTPRVLRFISVANAMLVSNKSPAYIKHASEVVQCPQGRVDQLHRSNSGRSSSFGIILVSIFHGRVSKLRQQDKSSLPLKMG